jgi:hypothetical protein
LSGTSLGYCEVGILLAQTEKRLPFIEKGFGLFPVGVQEVRDRLPNPLGLFNNLRVIR